MSIENNIKKYRENIGISQELIADKMHVSRQAVYKWETGESSPSTANLILLAEILNVDINELIYKEINNQKKHTCTINFFKFSTVVSSLTTLFPFAFAVITHNFLPLVVPLHYNSHNQIDRYGSKNEMLFLGLALSAVALIVTFCIVLLLKKQKFANWQKSFIVCCCLLMSLAFLTMQIVFSLKAVEHGSNFEKIDTVRLMCCCLCVLFMLAGAPLPFIPQNLLYGLRTSNTLNDKNNWIKTHKLAGITIVAGGVCGSLVATLAIGFWTLFSFAPIVASVLIPVVYSAKIAKIN